MKALFISDNHGDADILIKVKKAFEGQVNAMFHCGDSNLSPDDPALIGYQVVVGNTDWDPFPRIVNQVVDGERVFVTHGHLYQVNHGLLKLKLAAEELGASVVAYGHTHQLACQVVDGILLVNPGSISQPRGEYDYLGGTFATVETTPTSFIVRYYNRDLVCVGLDKRFKR
ncbi:MAG: metallophosphoesterase [Limosilactobacillus gorillae]|jgi:uncharacterized protein|uniref:metallophosphoesterase n=1 Tax=Limosilactobacillus gorillae TaxID=1450649 RepID=UPI000ADAEC1A|nr:metallophosphoesterase [Limosilactobacillus gorillae]MDO4856057.1 metallophosphoesterase [Limosilactobacillus gorillae]